MARLLVVVVVVAMNVIGVPKLLAEDSPQEKIDLTLTDPRSEDFKKFDSSRSMQDVIREFAADPSIYEVMKTMDGDVKVTSEQQNGRWATGQFDPDSKDVSQSVRGRFVDHSQKRAAKLLVQHLGVEELLRSGLNLDIDFTSDSRENPKSEQPSSGSVSYGLIVESIEPSTNPQLTAHSGTTGTDDLQHAPKANVQYKIGPKISSLGSGVGNTSRSSYSQDTQDSNQQGGSWPSPKFTAKVKQINQDDLGQSGASGKLPPMAAGVYQTENLYRMEYRTKDDLAKDGVYHGIILPVKGTLSVDQELNERFVAVKTSAKGLLIRDGAPQVDVHYLNQDARYQGDIHLTGSHGYDVMIKAHSASPVKNEGPKIEMGLQTDF